MPSTVRELLDESIEAMHRADESALAALYHPNAALHQPGTEPIVGREAIGEHVAELLRGQPKELEHEVTEEHVHHVTPDLAIVDTMGTTRLGEEAMGREGFTMVAIQDPAEGWLWAGIRGALVPK